jgi:AcrR family transcriptional regulator
VKQPDRRIARTRRQLRDALVALILEQGYESVTVQAITDRADLSRATFYLHFKDKEDLMLASLREMFDDLRRRYSPPQKGESPLRPEMPMRTIPFQHALEYRDLYRVTLLSEQGTAAILRGIRLYLADAMRERIEAVATGPLSVPVDGLANYLAGGMLALISWWLDSGTPQTPEEMAALFQQMTLPTMTALLGHPPR